MRLHRSFALFFFLLSLLYASGSMLLFSQENKENADFKLAVGLYNDNMYDLAIEQLKNFINTYPGTAQGVEARYYLGLSQLKLKRFDDARSTFQNFALSYSDHPKAPEAWMNVGEAFLALKNEREAASAFERIRVFHPKSPLVPEGLLRAGTVYRRLGDREAAKRMFRAIIQEYPSSKQLIEARLAMGELYAEEGQTTLAEQEIRRVRESEAPPAIKNNALLVLGKIQVEECLFDQAESTFTRLVQAHPKSSSTPLAAFELGKIALSAQDYGAAINYFTSVASDTEAADSLRAEASYQSGLSRMRYLYSGRGSHDQNLQLGVKALKSFEEFLSRFPNNRLAHEAHLMALRAARFTSSTDAAIQHANTLLASATLPLIREKALFLGALASEEGKKFDQAIRYYTAFITEYPDDPTTPFVYKRLGELYYYQLKNPRRALVYFEDYGLQFPNALKVSPVFLIMAECYSALGEGAAAADAYEKVLQSEVNASIRASLRQGLENLLDSHRDLALVLDKLAQLLQGSVLQPHPSKPAFLYRLGKLYFDDLRDFEEAAKDFDSCITAGIGGDSLIYAKWYLARSYDRLSYRDSTLTRRALALYDELINSDIHNGLESAIIYDSYKLHTRTGEARIRASLGKEYLTKYPLMGYQDEVLSDIARFSLEAGDSVSASVALDKLIARFPHTPGWYDAIRLRGEMLLKSSSSDSAIVCWKRALSTQTPSSLLPTLWMHIADTYHERKEFSKAAEFFEMLTDTFPDFPLASLARMKLAEDYMQIGKYRRAIALYEDDIDRPRVNAEELEPSTSLYAKLGTAYEKMGNYPEAVRHYCEYLALERTGPLASSIFYALGGIARMQGNTSLAASYLRQAAAVGERSTVSRDIADLLFQSEQYTGALNQYEQLSHLSSNPDSMRYFQARAIVATLRMDKLPEAQKRIGEFEASFKDAKPERAEIEYEKGLYYYRMQEYASAKKTFEKISNDYSDTRFAPWSRYYNGKIAEVTNKLDDAAKIYEEIISKSPESDVLPHVFLSLGNMHFNAERFEQAIKYYQEITKDPERAGYILPYAMNNLIEAFESLKLYDAALKTTCDFIEHYPNDESIIDKKIKIGALYTHIGYYDQAVQQFQIVLNDVGSSMEAELRYNIGEAYYYKGDYQQAILEFLKVPYLVAQQGKVNWTATSLYMAGQAYEKMSKFDEAIGMYRQIIERSEIDATFKSAARKEIDRVKGLTKKGSK
ncbi:MAG: tetratricopeptide repeat protein [Ignavibacteriae bacterium]|nr:tetratricopeptide repeat protein [Ignavibacteriota bacterium]